MRWWSLSEGESRLFNTTTIGSEFGSSGKPCTGSLLFSGAASEEAKTFVTLEVVIRSCDRSISRWNRVSSVDALISF